MYKGIETLEKVINAYPYNINAMVNLEVAYETFKQVLEIKPDYPKVLANMGKIYMRHGDGVNALRCFTKAAEYDNENILVHINLKQPDKAFYHMQKYIEMKPGDQASEQFKRILAARKLNRDRL